MELPGALLQSVLSKVDAGDCARVGCVNRRWHEISTDDTLWRDLCLHDFHLSSPVDFDGRPCASFQEAYRSWRITFKGYPTPLVSRAKRCVDDIKEWLRINFTEMLGTLAAGASFKDIEDAEEELGFELPAPVRLLYILLNGQALPEESACCDGHSQITNHVGLLGGYHFYDHLVNVHLLPLKLMVRLTLSLIPKLRLPQGSKRVVIGASFSSVKVFFLDCEDGQVYVGLENLQQDGEMMPCTPKQEGSVDLKDGMLRWLERYNHCLQTGMYKVRVDGGIRRISLFPSKGPLCTEATTRGIQIQTSAVFIPERSREEVEGDEESYQFAYSVGMRMVAPSCGHGNSFVRSAQLLARHWVISPDGLPSSEVRGPAVIGRHPLLEAGGKEFAYQSCSPLKTKSGNIEGDFTFVPGRMTDPAGAEFAAYVARFPLEVPQYIF